MFIRHEALETLATEAGAHGDHEYAADLLTLAESLAEHTATVGDCVVIGDSGEQIMIGPGEVHRLAAAIRAGAVEVADSGAPTITAEGLSATGSKWHRWIMLRE